MRMHRLVLVTILCLLSLIYGYLSAEAQTVPNRRAQVQAVRSTLCAGVPGDDVNRRRIIATVVNELNKIDVGQWGLLYRFDREDEDPRPGRLTADVIVWKQTKEHFDVLSESGVLWIAHGPITDSDWRVIDPSDLGGFATCSGGTPPVPPVDPPTPPPSDLSAILNRLAALEAQNSVLQDAVNRLRASHNDQADRIGTVDAGLSAALERLFKVEQKPWPALKCSGRVLLGIPVQCNVVPDTNPEP